MSERLCKKASFPTRAELLNLVGDFTWSYGQQFFIEVEEFDCNFTWNDPDYGGDNKIEPYCADYKHWAKRNGLDGSVAGRSKGEHIIGDYCGSDVIYEPGDPE